MTPGQPSRTALRAAAHRAAHQTCEAGRVFQDPVALAILGQRPEAVLGDLNAPQVRSMRLFIAARSRFAEDQLAAAVTRGVCQYVVLGAGLDTFAQRNLYADLGLTVFEVDHPATQAWKRARLSEAGLAAADSLAYAPVDFERETLAGGLTAAGYRTGAPTFFSWLGVIVYLTHEAILDTLAFIAQGANEVVFDYGEPTGAYPEEARPYIEARHARVAAMGEPWISHFNPAELASELGRLGFDAVEDLGPTEIAARYLGVPARPVPGGHILSARRS